MEAGVDFEVVPGITSAVAGLTYAGIPMTYRDVATSFHVLQPILRMRQRCSIGKQFLSSKEPWSSSWV